MPVILDFIREECMRQKRISTETPDDHIFDLTPLNCVLMESLGIRLEN